MDINFELYKIFYHAAMAESFSDAAGRLFITQSAVSQAIKSLEEKIGSQLFYRKTRAVKLTNEGQLLFKHIEQAYNYIKTGETKISEIQNLNSGEMRIGVSDTICKYYLVPHLEEYHRKYPKVKIQVINRTSLQILDILKKGSVDFGIVTLPIVDEAISVEEFLEVQDIFVANRQYLSLKGKKICLQELTGYPLLLLQEESNTRRNLDSFLKERGINVTPEIELESIDLLVEFAQIGLGIAHVLKESAKIPIVNNELFEVELEEDIPGRKLGIASMKNVPMSRAAEEFIKTLK